MRIALDVMGGDFGPIATVQGAVEYAKASKAAVLLVGDQEAIEPLVPRHNTGNLEIVPSEDVITMEDHPVQAVRQKRGSSLVVAANLVKQGKADALVSAGNTGATMAAALFVMGRIPGIERPAIASPMPVVAGEAILLDVGANVDCRPKHLLQFAGMGHAYMEKVRGITDPTVGLLNIGGESSKGNELTTKAYELLAEGDWDFVGNIEGRQLYSGQANVVVCDGFVGNIVLKVSEGLGGLMLGYLWEQLISEGAAGPGGPSAQRVFRDLQKMLDYTEYGGAPLLGVNGVTIICHGSSNATAIHNALNVAEASVRAGLRDSIAELALQLGGERQ